ncbi:MAG: helix-turn-helix transcriptional regulator [Acidimicrobiaceae bacterium]|nr:helix-turn-helix transcriptional regulator [Acidimicrobiaceae bacterium]
MSTDAPDITTNEAMTLAQRLREAREHIGLRQEDIAMALDISRASVTAVESGKRDVTPAELRRLSRIYRRPVSWLLGDESAEADMDPPLHRATTALSATERERILRRAEFRAGAGSVATVERGANHYPGS